MKRLFLYLLALLPVISVVSLLLLAILLFPITLLPNSIFLVISFEIMNSAIENVVDLASDY
ncbi:diacylglycerol kinase, partial [Streptococcus anginosus]